MQRKQFTTKFAVSAVAFLKIARATVPGNTLEDCKTFAKNFDNTCDSVTTPVTLADHVGTTVSCEGSNMRCPGESSSRSYTQQSPCTWTRKLCVTCSQVADDVFIRVQGNGLPNHCFNSPEVSTVVSEMEWQTIFQPDMTGITNYLPTDIDTDAKTDELLCDKDKTSKGNINAVSQFSQGADSDAGRGLQRDNTGDRSGDGTRTRPLTQSVGIALSGTYIFNALTADNKDAVEAEIDTLDVCLSHPTATGELHYNSWSPCIKKNMGFWSDTVAPVLCKDESFCSNTSTAANFVQASSSNSQTAAYADKCNNGGMIGLARDGHIILGPYNADGHAWSCDEHDICNGATVDGQYVYVSTETYPYVVGCWGPGPQQTANVSCSTNSCPKNSTSNTGKASLTANCNSGGNGGVTDPDPDITTPIDNNSIKQALSIVTSALVLTSALL